MSTTTPVLYLNRKQAAQACGVSVDLIDLAVKAGDLKARKRRGEGGGTNTKVLFTPDDLREWVEGWDET